MGNRKKPSGNAGGDGVGHGRPPMHTRFKRGQSGNPNGRPKGSRNFKTDVAATLRATVKVTRDGKRRHITTQEAALLRLREKALSGDSRALDRLLQLAQIYNNEDVKEAIAALPTDDAAILEIFTSRVTRGAADLPPTPKPTKTTLPPDSSESAPGKILRYRSKKSD